MDPGDLEIGSRSLSFHFNIDPYKGDQLLQFHDDSLSGSSDIACKKFKENWITTGDLEIRSRSLFFKVDPYKDDQLQSFVILAYPVLQISCAGN